MKIIIVRHAQTDENIDGGLASAESEVLLNEEGILQAQKLAEHLKIHDIAIAYTSPQHRAVHTTKEALKHHPRAQIVPSDPLKEQHLGIYEGKGKAEWKAIKKLSKEPFHLFKPDGGESYLELQKRATDFLHHLVEKHKNETVLLVSHGGTLGVLLLHLLEKELTEENYRAHQPKNAEVSIVEILESGQKKIHVLNSSEHLN